MSFSLVLGLVGGLCDSACIFRFGRQPQRYERISLVKSIDSYWVVLVFYGSFIYLVQMTLFGFCSVSRWWLVPHRKISAIYVGMLCMMCILCQLNQFSLRGWCC